MVEISPPDGCLTVGDLICALVAMGNMEAPVYLVGDGFLQGVEDDLGAVAMLHAQPE